MNTVQQTLFVEAPTSADPKEEERFDWYAEFCKERYGCAPEWQVARWEAKGDISNPNAPGNFVLVTGAVYPDRITKGKGKGRINYKVKQPGTEREFPILDCDLKQFKLEWQERTGKCHTCYGTGLQWDGWDHIKGSSYRACSKCKSSLPSEDREASK
jgi:hypothetical protein